MLEAFGFGLFPLPAYRQTRHEEWQVVRHLASLADGYASGTGVEPERYVLYHGRTAWMSTGLMEQESHAWHVAQATGNVVAAGLGLGLYAFAASLKPEVERVVVVEREPAVIAVAAAAADIASWPGRHKLLLLEGDALAPETARAVMDAIGGRPPDYLYADIWPVCADARAPAETAAMVAALTPRAAGWWGQELAFVHWCRDQALDITPAAFARYAAETNVPVPVSAGYVTFCAEVGLANGLPPGAARRTIWQRLLRRRQ
jgi:hypothetical protein